MATLLLVVIYISYIGLGIPDSLFGTAWPAIYTELGLPISSANAVTLLVSSGTIAASFLSGKFIHRFGEYVLDGDCLAWIFLVGAFCLPLFVQYSFGDWRRGDRRGAKQLRRRALQCKTHELLALFLRRWRGVESVPYVFGIERWKLADGLPARIRRTSRHFYRCDSRFASLEKGASSNVALGRTKYGKTAFLMGYGEKTCHSYDVVALYCVLLHRGDLYDVGEYLLGRSQGCVCGVCGKSSDFVFCRIDLRSVRFGLIGKQAVQLVAYLYRYGDRNGGGAFIDIADSRACIALYRFILDGIWDWTDIPQSHPFNAD